MPLYNYACRKHGEFSAWANLDDFDKALPCPVCGKAAVRGVSAGYLGMDAPLRNAFGASEKSAHEPRVVRRRKGGAIPAHDAHRDLFGVRSRQTANSHSHEGHSHAGHAHGSEGQTVTVRSDHPWLVRH